MSASRAEFEQKIGQFNTNWRLCGVAEMAKDWGMLNKMNDEHKGLIEWFATRGLTFNDLDYNHETSTFGLPESIMASAST